MAEKVVNDALSSLMLRVGELERKARFFNYYIYAAIAAHFCTVVAIFALALK